MTIEYPDDSDLASLQAEISRAFAARDAGDSAQALELWDELLAKDIDGLGDVVELAMAQIAYAKAHLLLEIGRALEAEIVAIQASDRAAALAGVEAQVLVADSLGTQGAALTSLGRLDEAVRIDERIVGEFGDSESFELRRCAARALRHEIWIWIRQKEPARAIASARRILEILRDDADAEHLIEVAELILSSSENLCQQTVWRRGPAELRDQAQAMSDDVLEMAERVGGDIGAAVTINARLALTSANARDRRLVAAAKEGFDRPPLGESVLPALEQVESAALEAGSQYRYFTLMMERAGVLSQLGRTDEAVQLLDSVIDRQVADGDKVGAALTRTLRRVTAS